MIRTNESTGDAHQNALALAAEYEGLVKDLAECKMEVDPANDKAMILMTGMFIGFATRAQRLTEALEKFRGQARKGAEELAAALAKDKRR